jgi:hypothetical protein
MSEPSKTACEDAYIRERKLNDVLRKDISDLRNIIYDLCGSKDDGLISIDDWYKKVNDSRGKPSE